MVLCAVLVAFFATPARAAWPPTGITWDPLNYIQGPTTLVPDGAGGVLGWWETRAGSFHNALGAGRVDGNGNVLWPAPDNYQFANSHGAADGLGGVFKVWREPTESGSNLMVAHQVPSGAPDPAWPLLGLVAYSSAGSFSPPAAVTDGAGGAIVTAGPGFLRLKRVLGNGTLDPAWPVNGRIPNDASGEASATFSITRPDGDGGAFVAWSNTHGVMMSRLTSSGTYAAGWGFVSYPMYGGDPFSVHEVIEILPSGSDGVLLCWTDAPGGNKRIWLLRVLEDGNTDPNWPSGILVTSTTLGEISLCSDGSGGAIIGWLGSTGPKGVRILQDGTVASGWNATGNPLTDAAAVPVDVGTAARMFDLAPGISGGAVVSWSDKRRPYPMVRMRWIQGDGSVDPAVADSGMVISPEGPSCYLLDSVEDGAGGAFVGWTFYEPFSPLRYVDLNRISHPEVASAARGLRASALSLGIPWPNPSHGTLSVSFALPRDERARLELLDIAGRRLRTLDVAGAGAHSERFDRLDELPAGVYLLRLTQGSAATLARIAHLR